MIQRTIILGMFLVMVFSTYPSNNFISNAFADSNSYTQISYTVKLGEDTYFIQFNACAGEKPILSPSILIESNLDTVHIESTKIIHENSCLNFESIITAKSPELIKITVIE